MPPRLPEMALLRPCKGKPYGKFRCKGEFRRSPRKLRDLIHFQRTKCIMRELNFYANFNFTELGVQSPVKDFLWDIGVNPWLGVQGAKAPDYRKLWEFGHFQSKKCTWTYFNFHTRFNFTEGSRVENNILWDVGVVEWPWRSGSRGRSLRKLWDLGHFQMTKCTMREMSCLSEILMLCSG